MKLRLLTGNDVRQCLQMPRAIDLMADAFAALSSGQVSVPPRTKIASDAGTMLYKPALSSQSGIYVVKAVSVFPGNVALQLPVTTGLLLVNDASTGLPLALMDAEYLTALRTGAASGLACRLLADAKITKAALFGAGGQAGQQLAAMLATLPLEVVFVFSRNPESAERFCREQAANAGQCRLIPNPDRNELKSCGVICTATTSQTPVFTDDELGPGVHINGVGSFAPTMAEVPPTTVCRATVFVDQREACLGEAGDLRQPIEQRQLPADFHPAELGEVVLGTATGRRSPDEVTFFKSVGNAVQDLYCATEILRRAEQDEVGTTIVL
jgi:ornithine cyclodeaminase